MYTACLVKLFIKNRRQPAVLSGLSDAMHQEGGSCRRRQHIKQVADIVAASKGWRDSLLPTMQGGPIKTVHFNIRYTPKRNRSRHNKTYFVQMFREFMRLNVRLQF